jgi:hypothetical protein
MGSAASNESGTNYPKKYWWLILVIVPLTGALIQYQPWKTGSGPSGGAGTSISGNQFLGSAIVGNVSLVMNEASKAGTSLDPGLVELLKDAARLSNAGQHDAAVAKIEQVRSSSRTVAALPSMQNSLAIEYLAAGKTNEARQTFEEVLKGDAANKTAWAGLGQLPDSRLKGLKVVNFSSQSGGLNPTFAGYIVDDNPDTVWKSGYQTNFPHTFVLELPVECTISALSFNNQGKKSPAKDIEISVSLRSASSGFEVATKIVLVPGEIGQGFSLKPAKRARWIKLRVLSNYGDPDFTTLGDVEMVGRPQVG